MENPYQTPSKRSAEHVPKSSSQKQNIRYANLRSAVIDGVKIAIKWVTIIVAPILLLVFLGILGVLVYRGLQFGIWPQYDHSQFWYSIVLLVCGLIAGYLVACFWVCLFGAIVFGIRHIVLGRTSNEETQSDSVVALLAQNAKKPNNDSDNRNHD